MELTTASQFLDSRDAIKRKVTELAMNANSWAFCVDRIGLTHPDYSAWRDVQTCFTKVRKAFVGTSPSASERDSLTALCDSGILRVLAKQENPRRTSIFHFEFDSENIVVICANGAMNFESNESMTVGVATSYQPTSTFAGDINNFFDRCQQRSVPLSSDSLRAGEIQLANSNVFHRPRTVKPLISNPNSPSQLVKSRAHDDDKIQDEFLADYGKLHRGFVKTSTAKKMHLMVNEQNCVSRHRRLFSRLKTRFLFSMRRWDDLVGLYRCPDCIRVVLVPRHRLWYDYLWLGLLLRPFHCPHCFGGYLRGIV